ncbi:hypothetical protein JVU11DRAFT_11544 [Chiua virens]|nr:hypothetical protein JVU11DRAFT_11544 [Chiua virens]
MTPFPLRGSQVAWAMGRFYARGNWVFETTRECQSFFHEMICEFDEWWPLRNDMFPSVPFPVALSHVQQQEVVHELDQLRQVCSTTI